MLAGRISKRALAELGRLPSVRRQVRTGADVVRSEARRLAPVRTGALRRSITVVEVRDPATGLTECRVGWDQSIADYGIYVEVGTEDTPAQPHLRPAANKVRGR